MGETAKEKKARLKAKEEATVVTSKTIPLHELNALHRKGHAKRQAKAQD